MKLITGYDHFVFVMTSGVVSAYTHNHKEDKEDKEAKRVSDPLKQNRKANNCKENKEGENNSD